MLFLKPPTKIPRFKKGGTSSLTIGTYKDFNTLSKKTHHWGGNWPKTIHPHLHVLATRASNTGFARQTSSKANSTSQCPLAFFL